MLGELAVGGNVISYLSMLCDGPATCLGYKMSLDIQCMCCFCPLHTSNQLFLCLPVSHQT